MKRHSDRRYAFAPTPSNLGIEGGCPYRTDLYGRRNTRGLDHLRIRYLPLQPVEALEKEEGGMYTIPTPSISGEQEMTEKFLKSEKGTNQIRTLGGLQELLTISEFGLYRLVMRSDKPAATAFRRWLSTTVRRYAFAPTPSNLGIFAVNFKRKGIH